MNHIPIVQSKLTMPQLPASVMSTDRIKKLINAINEKNAAMIIAPSGYGKTTLMIASLNLQKDKENRVCWYRLEQEDKDLTVFYAYLIEALFPSEDPQWQDSRMMLDGFAEYQTQYRYINAIICQELWAYYNRHPDTKIYIAFDDFQHVKDSPEICESLAYFICNVPDNCLVLISSRQEVNILTEKQKLEKNIVEIDQNNLCFIEKEITEFLSKTFKTNANKKLVQKILNSTEGWIAGVIMVCRIISDFGIVEAENLLEKPWQKTKLFNYIASEVLKAVEKEIMQFLVKVAVLQDFTAETANEILNIQNTDYLVSQCEKKGLFIQRIIKDDIIFRFHSLFRDALLQLQPEYMTSEEIKSLNLKAASYYIERKIFDKAIEHFIKCGDINSAIELITRESVTLITFEAVEQLRVWFNLLPEDVLEQNPSLLYIKSFTFVHSKSYMPMLLMEKAYKKFKENGDVLMQVNALMTLTNYGMLTYRSDYAIENISKALDVLESSKHTLNHKYMSQVFLFIRLFFEEKFTRANIFARNLKDVEMLEDWKWLVYCYASLLGSLTGDLDFAESYIKRAFDLNLVKRAALFKSFALMYYANILYLKNDISGLTAIEDELRLLGEKHNFNYMLGFGRRASAYRKYVLHDLETAIELLDLSINHFEEFGNTAMALLNKLCSLLWLSHKKNPKELFTEASKSFRALSSMKTGYCLHEIAQSIFGAIARECGEYAIAEECFLASIKSSQKKGAKQILSGTYLHLAKLYFEIGEKEKAERYLEKAFSLASNNKYSMFWDIHIPTLTEMSLRCIKLGVFSEYAKELLELYFKRDAILYVARKITTLENDSIKAFTNKVLSIYGVAHNTDFSCSIDIRLFGRFDIAVNEVHIPPEEWKTKKIKGILEYLIMHEGKAVSRDQLMDIFWPDSDKKSAAVSLRAALYELKKVLAKYGIKNDGDTPFIHERTGSLEIRPNNMLFIDVDEFLSLYKEFKRKNGTDKNQLMVILEKMISIYSDDLLSEEIYSDWTFADRETYKSIFQEAVVRLSTLYIDEKETHMAEKLLLRVMSIDPYNEDVCLILLNLYMSGNQRTRAKKLYSDFERRLVKDLGIKPDERLTYAIRNTLAASGSLPQGI